MARRVTVADRSLIEEHDALITWYREWLSEIDPEPDYRWPPVAIGPTWQRDEDGRFILPERTLGWDGLAWCGTWLQHSRDEPWRFTKEQARFLLWWMAVDERGEFLYHDAVLQRLKGWGKDPFGACLLALEMLGPSRFAGWDDDGQPIARDVPTAWVQTAAVSLEQTKNTMRLIPGLFTPAAKQAFGLQIGKEKIYALGDERLFEAVTSSPSTLEGARATFIVLNETHHWLENNDGHEMSAVIARNAAKSPDGSARTLRITNAYEPGLDSVAERDREAWEKASAGTNYEFGMLYDSLEASPDAPLAPDAALDVIPSIRGDSTWLHPPRIVQEIVDPRNPASRSRRFWYNQIVAAEDAWVTRQEWDSCADRTKIVLDGEQITLGFDGSKRDDHSALVGCRVEDSHLFTIAIWDPDDYGGEIPTEQVDGAVQRAFAAYDVVGFYSDYYPWESYVDAWAQKYGSQLCTKASGRNRVAWDMRGRQRESTQMAEAMHNAILERTLTHDGNGVASQYVYNARRRPNQYGVTFGKEHRESARKVDWLAAAMLARQARQDYMILPDKQKRRHRTGRARFA